MENLRRIQLRDSTFEHHGYDGPHDPRIWKLSLMTDPDNVYRQVNEHPPVDPFPNAGKTKMVTIVRFDPTKPPRQQILPIERTHIT